MAHLVQRGSGRTQSTLPRARPQVSVSKGLADFVKVSSHCAVTPEKLKDIFLNVESFEK